MSSDSGKKYQELYEEMCLLCEKNNWGKPFEDKSKANYLFMANFLNHKIITNYYNVLPFEDDEMKIPSKYYASNDDVCGPYVGIVIQGSWEMQKKKLENVEVKKYKNHYFARFDKGKIAELYKMDCEKVFEYLLPKVKIIYEEQKNNKRNPEISLEIPKSYILANSSKIV